MPRAHGVRLDHPIFQAPFRVDVVLDADHPYGDPGKEGPTWLVHSGEPVKDCDVGLVSDGHGFEDSPDCERICGGINSKGPMAVAIGRQANMLQWGFYGAPDRMTGPAKQAFLNAIVWMQQFDGQVPLVHKANRARTWLLQFIVALESMKPEELAKRGEGDYAGYLLKHFPAHLTSGAIDAAKLRAWYDQNVEYIGGGKDRAFAVDEDLQRLKLGNRSPAFLDWLLERLGKDPTDALALEFAGRYLDGGKGKDAARTIAWITDNRPFLFFSDTGGYCWFVDRNAQRAAKKAVPAKAEAGR